MLAKTRYHDENSEVLTEWEEVQHSNWNIRISARCFYIWSSFAKTKQNKTKPCLFGFFFLNSYFKVTYWQKNKIPQSQSISRTGTLLLTSEPGVSSWCCWNGSSIGKKHYLQAEVPFPGGSMATAPATRQAGFRSPKMAFSFQKSSSSLHDPNGVHRTLSDLLQGK